MNDQGSGGIVKQNRGSRIYKTQRNICSQALLRLREKQAPAATAEPTAEQAAAPTP